MNLAGLQRSLFASLHHGEAPAAGLLAGDPRGWAVYRASYVANLTGALRDVYPVTERLLGSDCFGGLARAFLAGHRSRHADLHAYGAGFSDFLRGHPTLAGLPYLAEVAGLEWLVHEAFHAADAAVLTLARLAAMQVEGLDDAAVGLHPSVRLMASDYPLQRIWQVNQPQWRGDPSVDLGAGGVALAVYRDGLEVAVLPLDRPTHALAAVLLAGRGLGEALEEMVAGYPQTDPAQALHTLLENRLVADFADWVGDRRSLTRPSRQERTRT